MVEGCRCINGPFPADQSDFEYVLEDLSTSAQDTLESEGQAQFISGM
jgi:hypothetical protein